MKKILELFVLVLAISSLVLSQDTTGDGLTTGIQSTTGLLSSTTGALGGTTGPTTVVTTGTTGTSGTTGVVTYVSYFTTNSTLNVTLPTSGSGATVDIVLPAIEGAAKVEYAQAAPGQKDYSNPSSAPTGLSYKGVSFVITIYDAQGNEISGQLTQPIVITLRNVENPTADDAVYFFDIPSSSWIATETTCNAQCVCPSPATTVNGNTITAYTCHLTQFAMYQTVAATSGDNTPVESKESDNSMLVIVIVVPIVGVGIVIGIVAWALVRKKSGNTQQSPQLLNQIEMGSRKSATQQTSQQQQVPLTSSKRAPDSSSDEDTSDEEDEATSESDDEEQKRDTKGAEEEESSSSSSDESSSSSDDDKSSSSSTSDSE